MQLISLSILVSTTRHIYLNLESSMKLIQIGNTAPNSILTTLSFVWTGVIMSTAIVSRSDWKMVDLFALGDLKVMWLFVHAKEESSKRKSTARSMTYRSRVASVSVGDTPQVMFPLMRSCHIACYRICAWWKDLLYWHPRYQDTNACSSVLEWVNVDLKNNFE